MENLVGRVPPKPPPGGRSYSKASLPGPPWDMRKVTQLGNEGHPVARIIKVLAIPQADLDKHLAEIEEVVAAGNARFEVRVQRRAVELGIGKGMSTIMMGVARNTLGWDREIAEVIGIPIAGALEKLNAEIDRCLANRRAAKKKE